MAFVMSRYAPSTPTLLGASIISENESPGLYDWQETFKRVYLSETEKTLTRTSCLKQTL